MPRRVPPTCKDCKAPGLWTFKGSSKRDATEWVFVDAVGMSDLERLQKLPYDGAKHATHACAPREAAPSGITPRVYLAGCMLRCWIGADRDESAKQYMVQEVVLITDMLLAELAKEKA